MSKQIIAIRKFVLFLFIFSFYTSSIAQETDMVRAAPEGLIVFADMELANGKSVDHYLIERSENKKQWKQVAELKSPTNWNEFLTRLNQYKKLFPDQKIPENEKMRILWEKAFKYGTIDSMRPWNGLVFMKLAAANAYYDTTAVKKKEFWYRVAAFDKKGKKLFVNKSRPTSWPTFPAFDDIVLEDQNVSKELLYLKWKSTGTYPAPYFTIKYYEDLKLKTTKGIVAKYKIDNTTYYIFQDSIKGGFPDRQYYLSPLDLYGNAGKATKITLISAQNVKNIFFSKTKALANKNRLGIRLSWRISDSKPIKLIKIFRSLSFDKDFEMVGTAVASDTVFTDNKVIPDKIYYYYLQAENKFSADPVLSSKFFIFAHDLLKPVAPSISKVVNIKNGVKLTIVASEVNMSGIRIYRSTGKQKDLQPICNLLPVKGTELEFIDTTNSLMPDQGYAYAAKIENNSHQLSDFSNIVYISSGKYTIPNEPEYINAYKENNTIKLGWSNMMQNNMSVRGYFIYRRENPKSQFKLVLPIDSVCISNYFTDRNIAPGKIYEYAVQTVNYSGNVSKNMAITTIQIDENIPKPPAGVMGFASDGKTVLQWGKIITDEVLQFKIYRYQRGKKPKELITLSLNDQQYIDKTVKKEELYFYYITTINQDKKESPPSREVSIRM